MWLVNVGPVGRRKAAVRWNAAARWTQRSLERTGPMSRGGLLRRFPVLGIRDFRLLLADRLIAPASVGFSLVGVSFAVLKATNSATDLSYVLAAQIAPSLVFALVGGVFADRFPPQRVIVAANLLMA